MKGRFTRIAIGSAALLLSGAAPATGDDRPVLTFRPSVVTPGAAALLTVSGIDTASAEARIAGRRWRPLARRAGRWSGTLLGPRLRGIYPIELRSDGKVYHSHGWLLRVLASRTFARPSFANPEAVAAWWAATVPRPRSRLVAIRPWRLPDGDRRDPRLHRLFVIAYSPVGDRSRLHRLGIWITAFRNGYGGRWRLLEATAQPPGPTQQRPQNSKPIA